MRSYLVPGHTVLDMPEAKQGWTRLVLGWETLSAKIYLCVHAHAGVHGGQKRVSDAMALEVQVAVSHPTKLLGPEFGSTVRTSVSAAKPPLQPASPHFYRDRVYY